MWSHFEAKSHAQAIAIIMLMETVDKLFQILPLGSHSWMLGQTTEAHRTKILQWIFQLVAPVLETDATKLFPSQQMQMSGLFHRNRCKCNCACLSYVNYLKAVLVTSLSCHGSVPVIICLWNRRIKTGICSDVNIINDQLIKTFTLTIRLTVHTWIFYHAFVCL